MRYAHTPRTPPSGTLAAAAHREHKPPRRGALRRLIVWGVVGVAAALLGACGGNADNSAAEQAALVAQGQQIFRFDTFGDETQWTDTLRMHEVIRTAVDPTTALSVGLKVDAEAGTYIKNPPGSAHTPRSAAGCTLFVKLRQIDDRDLDRVVIRPSDRRWNPGLVSGLEVLALD